MDHPPRRGPIPHPSGAKPPVIPAKLLPQHVAIVMDGNGRWAKQRGLPRTKGHEAGEAVLFEVIEGAVEMGIKYLSAYAFSTENWKRSPDEVRFLMGFNREVIHRRRNDLDALGVRVRWAGRRPKLWGSVIRELEETEEQTKHNDVLTMQFCVNYGGRAEIVDAARAIASGITSMSRPSPTSTCSSGAPGSSESPTSCFGNRPTPNWSSSRSIGRIGIGVTFGRRWSATSVAIGASAVLCPIRSHPSSP